MKQFVTLYTDPTSGGIRHLITSDAPITDTVDVPGEIFTIIEAEYVPHSSEHGLHRARQFLDDLDVDSTSKNPKHKPPWQRKLKGVFRVTKGR